MSTLPTLLQRTVTQLTLGHIVLVIFRINDRVALCATCVFRQQIEPSCYCRVFGEALDADMLGRILETLKNFYIRFVTVAL